MELRHYFYDRQKNPNLFAKGVSAMETVKVTQPFARQYRTGEMYLLKKRNVFHASPNEREVV